MWKQESKLLGCRKEWVTWSFLLHIGLVCVQGNLCMVEQTEKACHLLSLTQRALLSAYSYNSSSWGLCTVFNCFVLNIHKKLVFSCDFASLPDASHGDQSSRGSRCWVSGFPCSSDSFVIQLWPISTLQCSQAAFLSCGSIPQDGYKLHHSTSKHRNKY